MQPVEARTVISSLRNGIPPVLGVDAYTVGDRKLIEGIRRHHLTDVGDRGAIRFISGSWGSGKTHFFRLLREAAFAENCLVSSVELNKDEVALSRFERVFHAIVRSTMSPRALHATESAPPFGHVLRETLQDLASVAVAEDATVSRTQLARAADALMSEPEIDLDFKRAVKAYWETYLIDAGDGPSKEERRAEILEWFGGAGKLTAYKRYGLAKMVSGANARDFLRSLAAFTRLAGWKGLVILFDEAEQFYSTMRKGDLRNAQNNLLSLINNINATKGLFMVFATTPDFYNDPKHGIVAYGALASRIGKPEDDRPPRSLDLVWNFDAVARSLPDYQSAARRILEIFRIGYPDAGSELPSEAELDGLVREWHEFHPMAAPVHFWRLLTSATVTHLYRRIEGDDPAPGETYDDVMIRLKDD